MVIKRSTTSTPNQRPARRLHGDREAEIVAGAVSYFAEAGFGGTTRELARRIGVSQPLLYRYFPTKEALLDRVYEEVFGRTWQPGWDALLDGTGPADARIAAFYAEYAAVILEPRWIRLFLLSGLRGYDFPGRWVRMLRGRVFTRVIALVRADMGLPPGPATEAELEAVWSLHGGLVYLGVRRSLFGMAMPLPMEALVAQQVRMFLAGLRGLLAADAGAGRAVPSAGPVPADGGLRADASLGMLPPPVRANHRRGKLRPA